MRLFSQLTGEWLVWLVSLLFYVSLKSKEGYTVSASNSYPQIHAFHIFWNEYLCYLYEKNNVFSPLWNFSFLLKK